MRRPLAGNSGIYIFLLSSLMIAYSCKKEILQADQSVDFSYFPTQPGFWTEYAVDSIVHYDSDDFGDMDTAIGSFHFFVREVYDSPFVDGENRSTSVILRYRRTSDTLPWEFMNKWTANVDPHSAQKVEDNVRFVKLSFPIKSSASWNGNAFNTYPVEEYNYEDLFQPGTYGNINFDSTVTVIQNDFLSRINRIYKKEVYAAHAGMVYKQLDSVTTKNTTSNGTIILTGLEYKFIITGYSH